MRRNPRAAAAAGLTLIELLVAVAVSSVLVLVLAGILGNTGDIYGDTTRQMENVREGRAALERARRDLAARLPGQPVYFRRDDAKLETALGFFAALPARAQESGRNPGDVCFIGMVTAVTPDPGGGHSRKLYRQFASSADTLQRLRERDARPLPADPGRDDVLAFNVLDFRANFRKRAADGSWQATTVPAEAAAVELVLRVLTADAVAAMEDPQSWLPPGEPQLGFDFDDEEDNDRAVRTYRALVQLQR
jgi:prepilin-type N-terminal cleavage/methylation domain-containing protein